MSKSANGKRIITVTPTITAAGIYHANDCIGGKMTLTDALLGDGENALFVDLHVTDISNQKPTLEVLIFDSNPTAATLTDHAAVALSTAVSKVAGVIHVTAADWVTIGGMGFATVSKVFEIEGQAGSNNLYAAAMVTATPTMVGVNDLIFKFGLE